MKKSKVCVLVSGGLDSACLLLLMSKRFKEVFPLYIRCGLIWERAELYWLKRFLEKARFQNVRPLQVLKVPVDELYQAHWSLTGRGIPKSNSQDHEVYLPGRNLLLLSQAAVYCVFHGIQTIAIGTLKGNPFPDSQTRFFKAFEKLIRMGLRSPIKILAPFSEMTKSQVLQRGKGLPLELTFSCLKPRGVKPCGRCNKCAETKKAIFLPRVRVPSLL